MGSISKLNSISITTTNAEPKTESDDSLFKQVEEKWAHMKDEIKSLQWHEIPVEMLRDYLRATTLLLKDDEVFARSQQSLAIFMAMTGESDFNFSTEWPEQKRSFNLKISQFEKTSEVDKTAGEETSVNFGISVDADKAASSGNVNKFVREQLKTYVNKTEDKTKTKDGVNYNVSIIDDIPDSLLVSITKAIEDRDPKADEFYRLMSSAGVILLLQKADDTNSDTTTLNFSGLTLKGKPVTDKDLDVGFVLEYKKPNFKVDPLNNETHYDVGATIKKAKP